MNKIIAFLMVLGTSALFAGNSYQFNQQTFDNVFENSVSLDLNDFLMTQAVADQIPVTSSSAFIPGRSSKDPLVAFLLSTFLGVFGIHRAYMGTATGVIIGYILTCGGLGIVAIIDWVMLLIGLIDDDISQYIDNTRFFMWAD